jgi:hypothetical protein
MGAIVLETLVGTVAAGATGIVAAVGAEPIGEAT